MLAKTFTCLVRHKGSKSEPWKETFTKETDNPEEWCRRTIDWFNGTLRPGEKAREFVGMVGDVMEVAPPEHHWQKTSLVTQSDSRGMFDNVECIRCKITARRYELTRIKRSAKFRAQVYARCDTTMAHLEKSK